MRGRQDRRGPGAAGGHGVDEGGQRHGVDRRRVGQDPGRRQLEHVVDAREDLRHRPARGGRRQQHRVVAGDRPDGRAGEQDVARVVEGGQDGAAPRRPGVAATVRAASGGRAPPVARVVGGEGAPPAGATPPPGRSRRRRPGARRRRRRRGRSGRPPRRGCGRRGGPPSPPPGGSRRWGPARPRAPAASAAATSAAVSPTITQAAGSTPRRRAAASTMPGRGLRQAQPSSSPWGQYSTASKAAQQLLDAGVDPARSWGPKWPRASPLWFVTSATGRPAARSRPGPRPRRARDDGRRVAVVGNVDDQRAVPVEQHRLKALTRGVRHPRTESGLASWRPALPKHFSDKRFCARGVYGRRRISTSPLGIGLKLTQKCRVPGLPAALRASDADGEPRSARHGSPARPPAEPARSTSWCRRRPAVARRTAVGPGGRDAARRRPRSRSSTTAPSPTPTTWPAGWRPPGSPARARSW